LGEVASYDASVLLENVRFGSLADILAQIRPTAANGQKRPVKCPFLCKE